VKVRTICLSELETLSLALIKEVQKKYPDIDTLAGIVTGGAYISRFIEKELRRKGWQGNYLELSLSRGSTQIKRTLKIKQLLTKLPYRLLDLLRTVETRFHEVRKPAVCDLSSKDLNFSKKDKETIKSAHTLLLVDDAVDTGTTLLALKQAIEQINPDIHVITAVLTVTHRTPYIEPEYTLFRNVLLRCPWAEDYKGEDKLG